MATLRVKCSCGNVMNAQPGDSCSKCRRPLDIPVDGMISLYRKGSPFGIAGGFGIYIDNIPYGYIANKETVHIPLPYGQHKIHVAAGMNRRCNDLPFELSPENRIFYSKVYLKPGFWTNSFILEVASKDEMPETL